MPKIFPAIICAAALAGIPAWSVETSRPAGSGGGEAPQVRAYQPPPVSIWLTPAVGRYGKSWSTGGTLRFAAAKGWGAGLDIAGGEEMCIFCDYQPERFYAGALLFGIRGVEKGGYIGIAAGPSVGQGTRSRKDPAFDPDTACTGFLCGETRYPEVTDEGLGFKVQAEAALTGRFIGIGAQVNVLYIPSHVYAGVALILPLGLIR